MSIERINDLSKALTAARAVLAQEQKHLNTLLMQDGQSLAEVHFCGHKVALTYLDRLTGYFPRRQAAGVQRVAREPGAGCCGWAARRKRGAVMRCPLCGHPLPCPTPDVCCAPAPSGPDESPAPIHPDTEQSIQDALKQFGNEEGNANG